MVIFIGGIHGSGKGAFCKKISSELNIPYFTASELLNWRDISPNIKNKQVLDIYDTQNRLLLGLIMIKEKYESFILDGHFCLFNNDGKVEKIAFDVFEKISPNYIGVLNINSAEIAKRLKARDNIEYSIDILNKMQTLEQEYSEEVAKQLKIPYFLINNNNPFELLTAIRN
ncbi:ATP-binding protein [Fluviicola sp.]|uniref:ATP-binding protein n=1 Tax=Fluviicola sp. TaxID=1917219 RepID=UPI003D29B985